MFKKEVAPNHQITILQQENSRLKEKLSRAKTDQLLAQNKADQEYQFMQDEKDRIIHDLQKKIEELQTKSIRLEIDAEKRNATVAQEKDREIEDLHNQISGLILKMSEAEDLNRNLIRITRERANADRELPNKRTNPGYVVLSSEQYREPSSTGFPWSDWQGAQAENNMIWKTRIQTYFPSTVPWMDVEALIWQELLDENLLDSIGIYFRIEPNLNGNYAAFIKELTSAPEGFKSGIYQWNARANCNSGYWELDIYHNKPLTCFQIARPGEGANISE